MLEAVLRNIWWLWLQSWYCEVIYRETDAQGWETPARLLREIRLKELQNERSGWSFVNLVDSRCQSLPENFENLKSVSKLQSEN